MDQEKFFLRQFIDEEIYIIDQSVPPEVEISPSTNQVSEPSHVYGSDDTHTGQKSKKIDLKYEGLNTKSVLLIVQGISAEEKVFLNKVLGAVSLSAEECALVSLDMNDMPSIQSAIENFDADIVVQFGGKIMNFLGHINIYQVESTAGKKALVADDLQSIMHSVDKKKLLWNCLKQLFLNQ